MSTDRGEGFMIVMFPVIGVSRWTCYGTY